MSDSLAILTFIYYQHYFCLHTPILQPMTLALWQCFGVVVIWTYKRILFLIQPLPEETTINRNIWFIPFLHENFVRNKITFVYVGNFTSFRCHTAKEWTKAFRIFPVWYKSYPKPRRNRLERLLINYRECYVCLILSIFELF